MHDYPDSENRAQGEALAEGTCAFLGRAFQAPHGPDTKPEPRTEQAPTLSPSRPGMPR